MGPSRGTKLGPLLGVFATAVLSFAATSFYAQWRLAEVDHAARDISGNAAPSIEHLASARAELATLRGDLARYAEHGYDPRDTRTRDSIRAARTRLDADIASYLALPTFPGEPEVWEAARRDITRVDASLEHLLDAVDRGDRAAAVTAGADVDARLEDASAAVLQSVELDARYAHDRALEISRVHDHVTWTTIALVLLSSGLTAVAAWLAVRALRRVEAFERSHFALVEARADELEQFSGRVAHDILSPLTTVNLALELLRKDPDVTKRTDAVGKALRSVKRVHRIVDGLLDFARAGAKPRPDARADLKEVVEDVAGELAPAAAEQRIALVVEPLPACEVRASAGVLTSLVANLARNAIKYMGDTDTRRITIRAVLRGPNVRVEVEDTGPGLPPSLVGRVFDAYVRAGGSNQPGIGLGLATVKRMADTHGGAAGVRTSPGAGCTFWFELPRAGDPREEEVRAAS